MVMLPFAVQAGAQSVSQPLVPERVIRRARKQRTGCRGGQTSIPTAYAMWPSKVLSARSFGHRHPEAARRSRSIAPHREAEVLTIKQRSNSSKDHGGGKRRAGTLTAIAIKGKRDEKSFPSRVISFSRRTRHHPRPRLGHIRDQLMIDDGRTHERRGNPTSRRRCLKIGGPMLHGGELIFSVAIVNVPTARWRSFLRLRRFARWRPSHVQLRW
jgi:hypothetical protein